MAKLNGSGRIQGRGVDLGRAAISDQEAREAQELIEHQLLQRCSGCGRRISIGFRFTSIDPRKERPVVQLAACATREDCNFAQSCRDGATCMESFELAWLDDVGVDAPASAAVTARNNRHFAEQQATRKPPTR